MLEISYGTVELRRSNLLEKFGVVSINELLRLKAENGS
jgi:FixJ family two-component response regulator